MFKLNKTPAVPEDLVFEKMNKNKGNAMTKDNILTIEKPSLNNLVISFFKIKF